MSFNLAMFKGPKYKLCDILRMLDKGADAYAAYTKEYKLDDLHVFLTSIAEIPPEKIPKQANTLRRAANAIVREFRPAVTASRDFGVIYRNLDDILRIDAGPQGALLQNMVKACLNRIVELESVSAAQDSTRNSETAIVKYVAEIRNLVESINGHAKDLSELRGAVTDQAQKESQIVLDAVREVVNTLFPGKLEDFQRLLLIKISGLRDKK